MPFAPYRSPSDPSAPVARSGGLELWGGYECTVNRIGDRWFDQTPRSGHEHRVSDLELFAELGMTSLRYPALWERISPERPDARDFRWTDERLPRIRELGMNPILTLCHHGSGPHWTSLVDDDFAPGLADHARAVAERYPWIRDWTPVNEPLTTARFSALYGYWYPHTQDEGLFWLALLNEIDATRLSMREIRRFNPEARLIQTDDLGFCHATEPLQCEADYQNQRRWIGWDLLCGMVTPDHPLWSRIASFGLADRLRVIADDPCRPAVIGVNHYLASERLLDHRLERHGERSIADRELGDCAGVPYVDVDAIRSMPDGVRGLPSLLEEAAQRYGIPVAVTECHNGATRDEQVRWFVEVWRGVEDLRSRGVDIQAVTAWSLLGSYDWNRMVTRDAGHYEVGVFDVRSGEPRPTALAPVLKALAAGEEPRAVGLDKPGWWRRIRSDAPSPRTVRARPLLIVGSVSPLVRMLARACDLRALDYVCLPEASAAALRAIAPWAVVDGRDWAGVTEHVVLPAAWDGLGSWSHFAPPEDLARACGEADLPLAVFSAHGDFDDVGARLSEMSAGRLLLVETDGVFTPWDRTRFAARALDALDCGLPVIAPADLPWSEAYGPDVIDVALDLLIDGYTGPADLSPRESWSLAEFVRHLAETADADPELAVPRGEPVEMPASSAVSLLPPGETMLERFVCESRRARREGLSGIDRRSDETRQQSPDGHVAAGPEPERAAH